MGERNNNIQKSIEKGRVPVLPFELAIATQALGVHIGRQSELGAQLGLMMQQSSETWHDNAPAEAIASDAMVTAGAAEKIIQLLRDAELFNFGNDDDSVTLGSLVEIRREGDDTAELLMLTGVSPDIPEEVTDVKGIKCVTISSPVGKSIFGKKKGDVTTYTVKRRPMKIEVMDVRSIDSQCEH